MRTLAILPVKTFTQAKQRLQSGLAPEVRQSLARTMFCDVLAALSRSSAIDQVIVVTAGDLPREIAQDHGARVVKDTERGHNSAAALGIEAAVRERADRVLLVPGDCPALDPAELDGLLARPVGVPSALVVPDRHGTGTNALLLTPPDALDPAFGPGSCERHVTNARRAGARAEVVEVPSLAMDVDTREDLEVLDAALAAASGVAARTRELLSKLTVFPKC